MRAPRRWAENRQFMIGTYCSVGSELPETQSTRGLRAVLEEPSVEKAF
jgi:hypothetical protein